MVSFVISRVATELPQKIFHAVRLESRDRLQEILFRLPGLGLVNVCLTAGAGETVERGESEVAATLGALQGGELQPQLGGILAPLAPAVKQPGGGEVELPLVAAVQNVGVTPAQLTACRDLSRRHEGDLSVRVGGDPCVGQAGVRHQGHGGVEIAEPGSLGDMAHTVSLHNSVHVLYILSRHPGQSEP